jgi:hypothetical protein
MNLFASAHALDRLLNRLGYRYCVIGGVALQRWGSPRTTLHVDITLLVEFGDEEEVAKSLLDVLAPRIDDAASFAVRNRVLLVRDSSGTPLDIAFGAMPFEARAIERASAYVIGDYRLQTCSAEDLIVHKVFAARPQDWIDVESVITRSSPLDWPLIEEELMPLLELKGSPEAFARLVQLRRTFESPE